MEFSDKNNFQTYIFNVILNNVLNEYTNVWNLTCKFSVITNFRHFNNNTEICEKFKTLRKSYSSDLKPSLYNEFVHFHIHYVSQDLLEKSPIGLLKCLHEMNLYIVFLSVEIAYCLFIYTAIPNSSAKRTFLIRK